MRTLLFLVISAPVIFALWAPRLGTPDPELITFCLGLAILITAYSATRLR